MTAATFRKLLEAHPLMIVTKHPNPAGLGIRQYKSKTKAEYVFLRPDKDGDSESYLPVALAKEARPTADGFTLMGGQIVYEWAEFILWIRRADYASGEWIKDTAGDEAHCLNARQFRDAAGFETSILVPGIHPVRP